MNLAGHTILIVEPEIAQFVSELQSAMERAGAETLVVRNTSVAVERLSSFHFSACVINRGRASGSLDHLISRLGDIPILLYGGAGAAVGSLPATSHLPHAEATVDSIMDGLSRLLEPESH